MRSSQRPEVVEGMAPDRCDVMLIGYENQENIGLRSIAAFLNQNGVNVTIQPCHDATKEDILSRIQKEHPRAIGFSLIFQRMLCDFADLISYLRQKGVTAHITIGGHYPTFEYKRLLETIPGLDSVVRHEGEHTLLELFNNLDNPDSWALIRGIAYRQDGEIEVTPARPLIRNLDALPFPVRNRHVGTHRGLGIRSIAGSRGCYYDCSFCSIQGFYREPPGPKRRARSPANVAREMDQLYHQFDTRIFVLQDDDVFMRGQRHRQWVEEFIKELERRKIADKILWRISCRIDDLDAGLLLKMKAAGLTSVYLGIESGNEQGLKTFNKHYRVKDIYQALDMLIAIDVPFEYGFMMLDPESTLPSVRENIGFLKRIGQDGGSLVSFCKMAPYAGTPIARRLGSEGRLEGALASPDYRFLDRRLNLLQLFLSQTFNFRNFGDHGLVERLRFAKFDCFVLGKFFSGKYDVESYFDAVRDLIRWCNESALETLSLATRFVENSSEEEIIDGWPLLQHWAQQEKATELRIELALDQLMSRHDFESDLR